jgi:hypothetical protein
VLVLDLRQGGANGQQKKCIAWIHDFEKTMRMNFSTACRRNCLGRAQSPAARRARRAFLQPYGVRRIGEGAFFGGQHGESVEDR